MTPRVLCPLLTPAGSAVPLDTGYQLCLAYPAGLSSPRARPIYSAVPWQPGISLCCASSSERSSLLWGSCSSGRGFAAGAPIRFHLAMDTLAFG